MLEYEGLSVLVAFASQNLIFLVSPGGVGMRSRFLFFLEFSFFLVQGSPLKEHWHSLYTDILYTGEPMCTQLYALQGSLTDTHNRFI